MNYNKLFENYNSELLKAGTDPADARATLYLLFEEIAGLDRKSFLLRGTEEVSEETIAKLKQAVMKVLSGTPVDYIIGKRWFCGLEFLVNESVLIPRQETELLVEEAVFVASAAASEKKRNVLPGKEEIVSSPKEENGSYSILDLCTGSGCIVISMAEMLEKEYKKSSRAGAFEFFASDLSEEALNTAKKNAEKFGKEIKFIKSDMFNDMDGMLFDMIVSNPPYIPDDQLLVLDRKVTEHEPHMALFGGKDGLNFYRIIAKDAKRHLNPGGSLLLEIGFDQGESVPEILAKEGYNNISVKKDYSGLCRIVTAYL